MAKYYSCHACGNKSKSILPVLNPTPPEDTFTNNKNKLEISPLDLSCCISCGLVFLNTQLDPSLSYSEYLYNSSTTVGLRSHFIKELLG